MKNKNNPEPQFYPDEDEIKTAQLACCGRYCNACESPAEYAWRKREVDMALLMERAIENELSESEKTVVKLHWYDGKSVSEISEMNGVTPPAVKKALKRSQEKLERVLGYAVCYQQNVVSESVIPVILGRARVISAARNAKGGSIGDRILRLRQSQCLTYEALGIATGIKPSRIKRIENGALPLGDELVAFGEFFSVSTDFILKGETNGRKENVI